MIQTLSHLMAVLFPVKKKQIRFVLVKGQVLVRFVAIQSKVDRKLVTMGT